MSKEKTIAKIIFGSQLYGCANENSDTDFKGVFLPTKEQVYLNKIPKSYNNTKKKEQGQKNTSDDIDIEMYSLHYFIKLACEGQTVALDMLHAPLDMLVETSKIWEYIYSNRKKFYTKNIKAFVGYARGQVARYNCKGSRLNAAEDVIKFLSNFNSDDRLNSIWSELPINENCHMLLDNKDGIKQYQVCGKIIQDTSGIGYFKDILQRFVDNYGARAKLAAQSNNLDWKAISHALRTVYEIKELLTDNTITFPLKNAEFIKKVKNGELDYTTEVSPILDKLMDEVEVLSQNSTLPEKPDYKFWDNFIITTLKKEFKC